MVEHWGPVGDFNKMKLEGSRNMARITHTLGQKTDVTSIESPSAIIGPALLFTYLIFSSVSLDIPTEATVFLYLPPIPRAQLTRASHIVELGEGIV